MTRDLCIIPVLQQADTRSLSGEGESRTICTKDAKKEVRQRPTRKKSSTVMASSSHGLGSTGSSLSPVKRSVSASTSGFDTPIVNLSRMTSPGDEEADISHITTRSSSPLSPLAAGYPPRQSYFEHDNLIMRRQPSRPAQGGGAKRYEGSPARFANMTAIFDDLEFSGWGTSVYLDEIELYEEQRLHISQSSRSNSHEPAKFGQFKATGISGNAVLGSV